MNKIFLLIFMMILLFFGYGVYNTIKTTQIKKEKRVSCQEKTITFENIANKSLIHTAIDLLKSANYEIISRIELSQYMQSEILNYISKEQADKFLINAITTYINENKVSDKKLIIDYYIYENDKEDKGKKSKKAKLYAGYLVFEFKLENQLIYKIQTDYMKIDTSDIPDRMNCIIKSFITIK